MKKVCGVIAFAVGACLLLTAVNVQAQQSSPPGRDPAPGREPAGEPKIPRKWHNEPVPGLCGALLIPCSHGILRPGQNPQVDPHNSDPNPDPKDPNTPPSKPKPSPQPVPPNEPYPTQGPVNKPGPDDDF